MIALQYENYCENFSFSFYFLGNQTWALKQQNFITEIIWPNDSIASMVILECPWYSERADPRLKVKFLNNSQNPTMPWNPWHLSLNFALGNSIIFVVLFTNIFKWSPRCDLFLRWQWKKKKISWVKYIHENKITVTGTKRLNWTGKREPMRSFLRSFQTMFQFSGLWSMLWWFTAFYRWLRYFWV